MRTWFAVDLINHAERNYFTLKPVESRYYKRVESKHEVKCCKSLDVTMNV